MDVLDDIAEAAQLSRPLPPALHSSRTVSIFKAELRFRPSILLRRIARPRGSKSASLIGRLLFSAYVRSSWLDRLFSFSSPGGHRSFGRFGERVVPFVLSQHNKNGVVVAEGAGAMRFIAFASASRLLHSDAVLLRYNLSLVYRYWQR